MKSFIHLMSVLFGLSIFSPHLEARGDGGGQRGGGGRSFSRPSPSHSSAQRSPMTGSKVSRPTPSRSQSVSRPTSKPISRPTPKPAAKPIQRPSVQKPATKPAQRPVSRPESKPDAKPGISRPSTKPGNKPDLSRPSTKPGGKPDISRPNRPDAKPGDRPSTLPGNRPGAGNGNNRPGNLPGVGGGNNRPGSGNANNRPSTKPMPRPDRPNGNKPNTLPGMVTYPKNPGSGNNRPNVGNRPDGGRNNIGNNNNNRNNIGNTVNLDKNKNRTWVNNSRNVHIDKVNVNRRNNGLNRAGTLPARNRNWNSNQWGGNKTVWGNNNININNNVKINNRYRENFNYAYKPNYWGARPWWGASQYHNWHHGHWNYGWNSSYYHKRWYYNDNDFASGFMWGIGAWSLGNMVYNMGYNTYRNPYPAPPVENTYITYTQPVSVAAAANPPGDEAVEETAIARSADALDKSRAAFKSADYVTALRSCDEAIASAPGDTTLHEYRALIYFALGRYSDAAGIMNPVLASGPGWGWDTMVGFYDSSSTYDDQLRKLEDYVRGTPDGADGHFLLGYHYMVCGHMEPAYEQFEAVVKLQPADTIAEQLRDLTKSSLPDSGEDDTPEQEVPDPVPTEKLVGKWVSKPSSGGTITFNMEESGDFVWSFVNGDQNSELKGTYGLDEKGLLVLTTEDTQMVSVVSMPEDSEMNFFLVGAPDGDPGLDFRKG